MDGRQFPAGLLPIVSHDARRGLDVGAIAALRAYGDGILADRRKQHELVREVAAHHARIRADRDHLWNAHAREYSFVCAKAPLVIALEVFLRGMEGIGVLHRELPHADQAPARARLVPELGLDLVDHERVFRVVLRVFPNQMHRGLLLGHAVHERAVVPGLKAR